MFLNDGCPNINAQLDTLFPQFTDPKHRENIRWLTPDNTVSELGAAFDVPIFLMESAKFVKVRHIPILEPTTGELKALISNVDYAAIMTPPVTKLPMEYLSDATLSQVNAFTKAMADQPIKEVFKDLFKVKTELLSSVTSNLRYAIEKLSKPQTDPKTKINRRYRTLPVLDTNNLLVGTLSYTDILKKLKNCQQFIGGNISTIAKQEQNLTKLNQNQKFNTAAQILQGAVFTHLPILKNDGTRIVTGIVDDLTIARYQHPILFNVFLQLTLDEICTSINEENTVKPTDSVEDVIDKFLTIDFPDKPTAILVCNKDNNGNFVLAGIVSYTDILKKFMSSQDGNIQIPPDLE